jgi:lipopolysaccharide/colanic/teichoic acid biosynthesis glycosyltransferase
LAPQKNRKLRKSEKIMTQKVNFNFDFPSADALNRGSDTTSNLYCSRIKRIIDVTFTLLMLLCFSPLAATVAILVRLDGGPVFFRQTRIGLNGIPFTMIKFRSMCIDAEAKRAELVAESDREGLCYKHRHDPRITPVGRLLRRTSLDELPQLINVLYGEMSLVGPRPALPEEVADYSAHALGRLHVLPGMTGLWQVSGRAKVGFDEMIAMDLHYARTLSPRTDFSILLRTVRVVLSGHGAY